MYFPATRVLTVLELLQSRKQISGTELAMRLEVDARTVRRYITMLQDLGVPIESKRGRYGVYSLRPGFRLPPLMFTDEEALALTLGLLVARKIGLTGTAPATEGALAKIERILPASLQKRVRAIQETLVLDLSLAPSPPESSTISVLTTAVQQERTVCLRYRAWDGSLTERLYDPYGVVYRSGFWYTVGYCHLREELRTFRLDRIVHVDLQEKSFTRPENFDCLAHVLRAIARTPSSWFVEVLLEVTLEEAEKIVPPALAILETAPKGVSFQCYVESLDWLAYMLVGLRCPFIIRRPPELRDALRRMAGNLLAIAERTE